MAEKATDTVEPAEEPQAMDVEEQGSKAEGEARAPVSEGTSEEGHRPKIPNRPKLEFVSSS